MGVGGQSGHPGKYKTAPVGGFGSRRLRGPCQPFPGTAIYPEAPPALAAVLGLRQVPGASGTAFRHTPSRPSGPVSETLVGLE